MTSTLVAVAASLVAVAIAITTTTFKKGAMSKYRKAIVAVVGAALAVIPAAFPQAAWAAPVIACLTALAVYLTPNSPAAPATPTTPKGTP